MRADLRTMKATPRSHRRYLDRFAPLSDFVRRNLTGDLSVEALAEAVHFSPFHFHRVFTAVTGETVGTFVRRLRLERAIQLMRGAPGRSLSEVAGAVGFGSLSAFSRAFRRAYGLPPSRWDRRSRLTFRAAEAGSVPTGVPDLAELIAAGEGPPVDVRLREVPRLTLATVRVRRPWESGALDSAYRELSAWLQRLGLPRRELLGISWDDVEVTPPEQIRYDLAAAVPPRSVGGRGGVVIRESDPLVVAAAHARGTLARVARVWDHLYKHWLPRSSFEPRNRPPFEWYHGWPETLEGEQWDLDCCIPVSRIRV